MVSLPGGANIKKATTWPPLCNRKTFHSRSAAWILSFDRAQMKNVSSLDPAAHLPPFSTGSALIRPELYIFKKTPPPPLWCCFARLSFFIPRLSSFSFIFTYFARNLPVLKASGLKFYRKKTCFFLPYLKSPTPPLRKSQLCFPPLINSSDGIQAWGGTDHLFC